MKISLHLVFVLMASTFGVSLLIASVVRTSAIDMPCAEAGDDMSPYVKEPLILRNDSRLRSLLLQENDMREALTADLHIPPNDHISHHQADGGQAQLTSVSTRVAMPTGLPTVVFVLAATLAGRGGVTTEGSTSNS